MDDREQETAHDAEPVGGDDSARSVGDDTTRPVGDVVVAYWTGLDRGWQALWFGLLIVVAHVVVQPF